jgi:hypothetical protein
MKKLKAIDSYDHQKTTLWVIHANKIPPHLGISFESKFFSLKVNGKDLGLNTETLISLFKRKGTSVLLIEIEDKPELPLPIVFENYAYASSNGSTCLDPVSAALNIKGCRTVHELLSQLEVKAKVLNYFGINLPTDFSGVPFYTRSAIVDRLKKLEL